MVRARTAGPDYIYAMIIILYYTLDIIISLSSYCTDDNNACGYIYICFFLKAMWPCMCFALPCVKYNNNEIITYIDIILLYSIHVRLVYII